MAITRNPTPIIQSLTGQRDPAIDECCALCASITDSQIVAVNLMDNATQWVVGGKGIEPGCVGPRAGICDHVVKTGEFAEVPDLAAETRFDCHYLIQNYPEMRRYASVVLNVSHSRVGTLSLLGNQTGSLTPRQRENLQHTARIISALLEQRRDSIELDQTQARLQDVALCTADCFWECDADLVVTWHSANAASPGLEGWRPTVGEAIPSGVICDDLGDPDPAAASLDDELSRHAILRPTLIRLERPSGPNWLSIAARHVTDQSGHCVAIRGSVHAMRDIVQIRRAESDRDMLLAQVARYVPGFFFQLEARSADDAQITFASDGLHALCGVDSEGVKSDFDSFLSRIHSDDLKSVVRSLEESAATLSPWHEKFRLIIPGQDERRLVAYATPIRHKGDYVRWNGFVADDSNMERLEQEKMAAEQASAAKSEFLSRVNHELRTPLNGVLGFAQLMATDPANRLAAIQLERLHHIETAGLRLLDLIDNMLNLTRLEQRDNWIQRQEVNLSKIVSECTALAQPLAHDKSIQLRLSMPSEPTIVLADNHAVAQVIGNLIANAVHYSDQNSPVFIAVQEIGNRYCVSVIDRGRGLSDEKVRMLFQPFNRLGAENSPVRGFGLGLSVSQALAETMGARITVKSTPGRGSSFRLHLEKASTPSAQAQGSAIPSSGLAAPGRLPPQAARTPQLTDIDPHDQTDGAHIVYAEDDRLNAVLVTDALQRRPGFLVHHVEDGEVAWETLQRQRPDLLLADINMPNIDGYELISRIRRDPLLRDLPCIAISADAMPEQIEAGLAAGFDAYWPKPINLSQLTGRVEKILKRKSLLSEMEELSTPTDFGN
ncbi:MAG: ATP-binding protein [Burkholderiaceae bacterium]